jgi:hypothetical protein
MSAESSSIERRNENDGATRQGARTRCNDFERLRAVPTSTSWACALEAAARRRPAASGERRRGANERSEAFARAVSGAERRNFDTARGPLETPNVLRADHVVGGAHRAVEDGPTKRRFDAMAGPTVSRDDRNLAFRTSGRNGLANNEAAVAFGTPGIAACAPVRIVARVVRGTGFDSTVVRVRRCNAAAARQK